MIINITNQIYKKTFQKHDDLKDDLLSAIEKTFGQSYDKDGMKISNTDFFKMPEPTLYADLFFKNFVKEISEDAKSNGCDEWQINDVWFSQFKNGDQQKWHCHTKCHYTNIYYLELPHSSLVTQIYNPFENKIFDIECVEGDVISFPSWFAQRSLDNETEDRKTIIGYNISFDIVNDDYILITDDIEEF